MTSRDAILQRIRSEVAKGPRIEPPPVSEVWPRENPDTETMAARFEQEIEAIHGEFVRVRSMDEAAAKLAELAKASGWTSLAPMDRPICREAIADLPPAMLKWPKSNWPPTEMAELSASLVAAEALLADTGSCLIACPTAEDRLLCYLPPSCVVIAKTEQLREHLPAAWGDILPRCFEKTLPGEFVIVTGPSRTADIEKVLILGVHGPKRLVVLLVG
ncbi:MAG: LUD domain-containing protein [Pirellulales bacterium]|nr:LUD domain-containing protein [Pirellulales bacterium]